MNLCDLASTHYLTTFSCTGPSDMMSQNSSTVDFSGDLSLLKSMKVALVLGNEGSGISPEVDLMSQPISVPMPGDMESLNVSQAGSILLFTLSDSLRIHLQQLANLGK